MFKSYLVFFSFLLLPFLSLAQGEFSISGKVLSADKKPIAYSDVRAYQASDSTFISGGMTDDNGDFDFSLPNGNYFLTIEYLNFKTDSFQIKVQGKPVKVGTKILKEDVTQLENVTVTAERSTMEFQIDKRVYNVGSDLNNQGTNASEMLENIPSVSVDADGNVSLRGNQNVRILVDGKYSGFSSSAEALKQLQSDRIEKVEIITNASARYDAEGDAGIINIVLKKDKKSGWNGSVTTRIGYPLEYGAGFNLNYRKDKWNTYINYDINGGTHPSNSFTSQELHTEDTSFFYKQHYLNTRKMLGNSLTLGADYDINKSNNISASFNFRSRKKDFFVERTYDNLNESNEVLSNSIRLENADGGSQMYEFNLGHKYKLKKEGGEWNNAFKFFIDNDYGGSKFSEISSLAVDSHYEKTNDKTIENYQLFQSDFIYPIFEKGKFETGIKSQWKQIDNDFEYASLDSGVWNYVPKFNEHVTYNEQVHAAYVMASNQYEKLGVQAGVRAEYSNIKTTQASNDSTVEKKYIDFFPSLAVSYKFNENQTLQFSYSKRIRRPGQWELMPYNHFGDNREMRVGNPNIDPEITHAVELGWMQYMQKVSLLSSVYYRRTENKIERMAIIGSDGIIYRTPLNIANKDAAGLEFNFTYNPTNWLKFNTNFNFYKEVIQGEFEGEAFNLDNFGWSNRTAVNATLPKKWRLQLSGNYNAPTVTPQGRSLAMYFINFGVSKDFWNNNATIGLNAQDLFNTRKYRGETNTPTLISYSEFQWRPRDVRLVFTYRFNQSPKDREKGNRQNMDQGGSENMEPQS